MKRHRKVRGNKFKDIKRWIEIHKNLDLDLLFKYNRDYAKIYIKPWNGLSLTNIHYAQPSGKSRKLIINGLIEIYNNWKAQLDQLNEPYYLKIWLFKNKLERSQVVCAIRDNLHFYDNTFEKSESNQKPQHINNLFRWENYDSCNYINETYLGNVTDYENLQSYLLDKKWFDSIVKKHYKIIVNKDGAKTYVLIEDLIWIGNL